MFMREIPLYDLIERNLDKLEVQKIAKVVLDHTRSIEICRDTRVEHGTSKMKFHSVLKKRNGFDGSRG